ncbi:nucleotidyltransferase [Planomonospora corallina]|uniref:Nucleotidyltransferase n=1 Tax=Planomonospora corallina TaxID=1806052 RepID=A0ABV8I8U9_9ACTN
MTDKGLDADGFIAREGSLSRVQKEFVAVVDVAREQIAAAFDRTRLHSAYLCGSIPRGTAIPAVSDLDLVLALHHDPTTTDRADADALEAMLDASFSQVNGVGTLLFSTDTLLSDLERHDLGWFVACLCTPLFGDDLAARLPRYRPTSLRARETNGDLDLMLPQWRKRAVTISSDTERRALTRVVSRRIVRTGFTLVMPRWGGWTSDLAHSAEIFAGHYPQRAAQMRLAAATARTPTADAGTISMLIDNLGPWLATEYTAVHGHKTSRT